MSAFTPGPWVAMGPVILADGFRIAQTHFSEKSDADARLVAAAPDLLGACELLDLIESNGVTHLIDIMPAVEAARAAIAKATGGN